MRHTGVIVDYQQRRGFELGQSPGP
jgi:hypothetical protein